MSNDNTEILKLSISQRLFRLHTVAQELEDEGVPITAAQVSKTSGNYILVFAHEMEAFSAWLKKRKLVPEFTEMDNRDLPWHIEAQFLDIQVCGYLTDEEKEVWENEVDPRDPA